MSEPIDAAWTALRAALEARCRALHEEVRSYPTPIARCDEQLTHVIDQRDMAFGLLRAATELELARTALAREAWRARVGEFAGALGCIDEEPLAGVRARLVAALERR